MPGARFVLVAETAETGGHSTHTWSVFWDGELKALLARSAGGVAHLAWVPAALCRALAHARQAGHRPVPGPFTNRPAAAPVGSPAFSTCTPFTHTFDTPVAYCAGLAKVA